MFAQVEAAGVNRLDLIQVGGKYPPPEGESDILGVEGTYLYHQAHLVHQISNAIARTFLN